MPEYILTAEHLKKVFRGREKYGKKGKDICAVEDVSFCLRKGESLGLIGEREQYIFTGIICRWYSRIR